MKTILIATALLFAGAGASLAQPADKIALVLDVRSEGRASADPLARRLGAEVQRGLEAIADVEIVPREQSRRTLWIVAGTDPGSVAASLIVTEQYDRETLMVLGIEDDDMAHRMMALQIVTDHQIFTGRTTASLAKRIVTAIDEGVLAKARALTRRNP